MSLTAARQLSKETGYQINWIPKGGYYVLIHENKSLFPLYTKERVLLLAKSLKEKNA